MDWEEYWDYYFIITNTDCSYIIEDRQKCLQTIKNLENHLKHYPNDFNKANILKEIDKYKQIISIQNRVLRLGCYQS